MALKRKSIDEQAAADLESRITPPTAAETEATPTGELKAVFTLRLSKACKSRLEAHFRMKGLSFGAGIRLALSEYMEKERIAR